MFEATLYAIIIDPRLLSVLHISAFTSKIVMRYTVGFLTYSIVVNCDHILYLNVVTGEYKLHYGYAMYKSLK